MINKKDFAAEIAADMNVTKKDAEAFMDSFLQVMTDLLANGETVRFTGFGEFGTKQLNARNGVNPSTGEAIKIPSKIRPYFKAGKLLKEAL